MWRFTKTTRVNTCKNDTCKKGEHVFLYIQLYIAIYFFQIPFEHHKNTG